MLRPTKARDMRLVGASPSPIYQAMSSDPQCRLEPADGAALGDLEPSTYQLLVTMFDLDHSIADPAIYLNFGDGFREGRGLKIPLQLIDDCLYEAEIKVARPLHGLRLDPSTRKGAFAIGPILIQRAAAGEDHDIADKSGYRALRRVLATLLPPGLNRSAFSLTLLSRLFRGRVTSQELANGIVSSRDRQALYRQAEAQLPSLRSSGDHRELYQIMRREAVGAPSEHHVARASEPVDASRCIVRPIAFYLPQFHPIPENDRWWGKGFTEWTNVAKAVPQFEGHYQPRRPGELGYYDLRLPDVMREQIALAKLYGLHGFCFHHYWFHGKRLLQGPVDRFLDDPTLDFKFCLCWANENWTRTWDGADHEVLIGQEYSIEDDLAFFDDLVRYMKDGRYICVDGKPVLVVYRPSLLPFPEQTATRWREEALKRGFPGLFLIASNSFGFTDPGAIGFDALVEFPPHGRRAVEINETLKLYNSEYKGLVYSYADVAAAAKNSYPENALVIPGIMPSWDNESRRPGYGNVMHGSTPELFREWMDRCFLRARQNEMAHCPFVFINAWNEWAEGAYLEPDSRFGYAYLSAISSCIQAHSDTGPAIDRAEAPHEFGPHGEPSKTQRVSFASQD